MSNDYIISLSNDELFKLVKEKFGIEVLDENDIAGAWQLVEMMQGMELELHYQGACLACVLFAGGEWHSASAETAPLAIYRAALLACEGETGEQK